MPAGGSRSNYSIGDVSRLIGFTFGHSLFGMLGSYRIASFTIFKPSLQSKLGTLTLSYVLFKHISLSLGIFNGIGG